MSNNNTRWTRNKSSESCYDLDLDKSDMCDKCREFKNRMEGIGKKPRKGTTPKCERIKLFQTKNNRYIYKDKVKAQFLVALSKEGFLNSSNIYSKLSTDHSSKNDKVRLTFIVLLSPISNLLCILGRYSG